MDPIAPLTGWLPRARFVGLKPFERRRQLALQKAVKPMHALQAIAALRGRVGQNAQPVLGILTEIVHQLRSALHEPRPSHSANTVVVATITGADGPLKKSHLNQKSRNRTGSRFADPQHFGQVVERLLLRLAHEHPAENLPRCAREPAGFHQQSGFIDVRSKLARNWHTITFYGVRIVQAILNVANDTDTISHRTPWHCKTNRHCCDISCCSKIVYAENMLNGLRETYFMRSRSPVREVGIRPI